MTERELNIFLAHEHKEYDCLPDEDNPEDFYYNTHNYESSDDEDDLPF